MPNFFARWFLRLLSWLPLRVLHAIGAFAGTLSWHFPTDARRTTLANLKHCFPTLEGGKLRDLARLSLQESGKSFTEAAALWSWPKARVLELVREAVGFDSLLAAVAEGRGVILAAPHLGAWEMAGLYCSTLGRPLTSLYRPPKTSAVGELMREGRERMGAHLAPADQSGVKALLQTLKEGNLVGILPDQDPGQDRGVFATFFGIEANTMTLLSRLAQKTDAPVFLVYAQRLPKGVGYRLVCRRCTPAIGTAPLNESVRLLNAAVETIAREVPEQYLWSYKRFKTRPQKEQHFYD